METQPLTFILVMAALALTGVVVFVIYLVVRNKEGLSVGTLSEGGPSSGQRWFEYLLAVLALVGLVVAVIVVIVFLYPSGIVPETAWRGETRSMVFLVAMLVFGLGALVAFVIGMFARRRIGVPAAGTEGGSASSVPDTVETPAGTRLPWVARFGGCLSGLELGLCGHDRPVSTDGRSGLPGCSGCGTGSVVRQSNAGLVDQG